MNEELSEKGYDANYGKYCDHTVLRAYTTSDKVIGFCRGGEKIRCGIGMRQSDTRCAGKKES